MSIVSIIIPTFNRSKLLDLLISSYLNQPLVAEIIIVDDGSTIEDSLNIRKLCNESNIYVVRHEKRLGLPAARNTGIDAARSSLIFFGEDDVWLEEGHLGVLYRDMVLNNADIIAGRLIKIDSLEEIKSRPDNNDGKQKSPDLINFKHLIGSFSCVTDKDVEVPFVHACSLIRKPVFTKIRYDASFLKNTYFREETDFYLRAWDAGYKIIYCPHTIAFHVKKTVAGENIAGGCGPKNSIVAGFQNQINNLKFSWKNRKIIKKLGIDPLLFISNNIINSFRSILLKKPFRN